MKRASQGITSWILLRTICDDVVREAVLKREGEEAAAVNDGVLLGEEERERIFERR